MLNRTALTVFLYASFLYFLKRIVFVKRHVWFFRIYMMYGDWSIYPFLLMAVLINWLISLLSGRDSHLRKSLKKTSNTGFVCNMNISVLPNKEKNC